MVGVYMYTNRIDGKRYIGKSKNIEFRKDKHIRNARNGRPSYFYNAIRKYGIDSFDFVVLEECQEKDLDKRERYFIQLYGSMMPNGYNMTPGGDGHNVFETKSEEEIKVIKERMSRAHTGKKHTDEERLKISLSQKGKPRLYARGRPSHNKGKKMSAEFCRKISEATKGEKNGHYGKKQSELCRRKNSEIHKGVAPANKGKRMVWNEDHTRFHYE